MHIVQYSSSGKEKNVYVNENFLQKTPSPFRGARQANSDTPLAPSFESPDVPAIPATSPDVPAFPATSPDVPVFPATSQDVPAFPATSPDVPAFPATSPDVPAFPATSPAAAAYLDTSPSVTTNLPSFPSADVSPNGGPDVTSSPVWTPDLNATTADMRWSAFEDDSYGADRRPSPRLAALLLPAPPAAANSTTVAGRVTGIRFLTVIC